jgi:hypothetical protein
VDCFDPSDPDRTNEGERGNLTVVARVPVRSPALSGSGLMLATDLGPPVKMEWSTRCGRSRRCHVLGRRVWASSPAMSAHGRRLSRRWRLGCRRSHRFTAGKSAGVVCEDAQ